MKRTGLLIGLSVTAVSLAGLGAQDVPVDRVAVTFSDPGRPGLLRAGLVHGSITVRAYDGTEVVVEARAREPERQRSRPETTEGLRRIRNSSTGLSVEEDENVMRIATSSHSRAIDLVIQVPVRTSLRLSCVNDGDIEVEGVNGEIEVSNTNGAVTLTRVSGSAVAHALNGDLVASFVTVDPDKPMSFSSLNGDVDVTLPFDIRATVKIQTQRGEILSDFDIALEPALTPPTVEDDRERGGRYRVRIEKGIAGTINGGGQEIQFKNFNGDVRIRRGGV